MLVSGIGQIAFSSLFPNPKLENKEAKFRRLIDEGPIQRRDFLIMSIQVHILPKRVATEPSWPRYTQL
jgi:hypothetical protein